MPEAVLKARGFRCNFSDNPNPRAWYIDFDDGLLGDDSVFLCNEIYRRNVELLAHEITAINRFSDRV
ncbi:MAG: hypothetical protein ABJM25_19215 [Parvibaculum sp.]|uniref:hypothetical protein n=1 Tax=Parvibaculum sp. TaxID=2024848 RepID=UPI003296E154